MPSCCPLLYELFSSAQSAASFRSAASDIHSARLGFFAAFFAAFLAAGFFAAFLQASLTWPGIGGISYSSPSGPGRCLSVAFSAAGLLVGLVAGFLKADTRGSLGLAFVLAFALEIIIVHEA